jgi:ubiquitin C-terminal hydrolase
MRFPPGRPTQQVRLNEVLQHWAQEEKLQCRCKACDVRTDVKFRQTTRVCRFPAVLVIHLARFGSSLASSSWWANKINTPVAVPVVPISFECLQAEEPPPSVQYELIATANHRGKADGGHYVAHVRDQASWYQLNDDKVVPIDTDQAEQVSQDAYILFFHRNPTQ